MIRLILAALSLVLGLVAGGLSVSALSVVGTDDVTETAPLTLDSAAHGIVFNQGLVPFEQTTATVHVKAPEGNEVFLGTANGVDATSYLTGVAHEEITSVEFPQALGHRFVAGDTTPKSSAQSRDWWLDTSTGPEVSRTFEVGPDAPQNMVVVLPADMTSTLEGAQVWATMSTDGVFGFSLLGLAIALLLIGVAIFLFLHWRNSRPGVRRRRRARARAAAEEGVGARSPGTSATAGVRGPGQRDRRSSARRGRSFAALVLVPAFAVAGCTPLPVAQPHTPILTPAERPAVREGEAAAFLERYNWVLDEALSGGSWDVDTTMYGPLLERTRAEMAIAEAGGSEASAVPFAQVSAGGPVFSEYPMWFFAFAEPTPDSENVQVMLATRESAADDWKVPQALFIPRDQMPVLLADGAGGVEPAPKSHVATAEKVWAQLEEYLETGKVAELDGVTIQYPTNAFTSFREYVEEFTGEDSDFDSVDVQCTPYAGFDFSQYALSTESGSIAVGEMRCSITFSVLPDFALDLGEQIDAVMTTGDEGNIVTINTSLPLFINVGSDDVVRVSSPDWFLLSAETREG